MNVIDKLTSEIISHGSTYIAERVGTIVKKCAFSPNTRDRMDLNCLLTDSKGHIITQTEHIPVHLGSMYVGMKNFLNYLENENIDVHDGDVFIVNDPYIIGTHLNDVTVLKPIFQDDKLISWIVRKAHHVDVGGSFPGNLSIHAKTLYGEGLVIPLLKIVEQGRLRRDILKFILSNVRIPKYTLGDSNAQYYQDVRSVKRG